MVARKGRVHRWARRPTELKTTKHDMEELAVAIRIARKKLGSAADDTRNAQQAAGAAIEKIEEAITAVAASVGPALGDARERLTPLVGDAKDRLTPLVGDAKDRLTPLVGDAKDRLTPLVGDAKDRLTPVMGEAKDRIGPALETAKDRIAPVVDSARETILPAAGTAVAAGRRGGRRAAVRLGLAEEPKPRKSHRIRNALIILGLGGAAAFLYTKLTGRDADPAWTASRDHAAAPTVSSSETGFSQSEVKPTPSDPVSSPSDAVAAAPVDGETDSVADQSDTAPTAPFQSEETVESHTPTTPDKPLEERDV